MAFIPHSHTITIVTPTGPATAVTDTVTLNKKELFKQMVEIMPDLMREFCPYYHKKRILLIEKFKRKL